jgi:NADPH:quinone reductase-like Zn-dependent oxidoreductase
MSETVPVSTMRLRKPGGIERLYQTNEAQRKPRAGEVLVRIRASSLNYHDYGIVTGNIPTEDGRIPLSDGAGDVMEVGEGVNDLAPGDHVIGTFFPEWLDGRTRPRNTHAIPGDRIDGFAREFVTMPATAFTRAPRGYSHVEAATLPCAALTAWRALMVDGPLQPGEVVLVQGTGGVSIFALQFAKAAGATVIATSSSDEKLARLRALGADHLINYRTNEKWGDAVRVMTDGRGADHVVEVGGPDTLAQSMTACAMGGHIALLGVLTGREGKLSTGQLLSNQIRLQGLTVGSRSQQMDMIRAIEAIDIRPVIDCRFALRDLAEAFRFQETGRHFGKIGIDI